MPDTSAPILPAAVSAVLGAPSIQTSLSRIFGFFIDRTIGRAEVALMLERERLLRLGRLRIDEEAKELSDDSRPTRSGFEGDVLASPSRRAQIRLLDEAERAQRNLDEIGIQTLHLLSHTSESFDENKVNDDFLTRFISQAQDVTSEQMRSIYSFILSGELQRPGSVSMGALHLLRIMDIPIAHAVGRASAWLTPSGTHVWELRVPETFKQLSDAGYLSIEGRSVHTFEKWSGDDPVDVRIGSDGLIRAYPKHHSGKTYASVSAGPGLNVRELTRPGAEILRAVGRFPEHEDLVLVAEAMLNVHTAPRLELVRSGQGPLVFEHPAIRKAE